MHARFIQYWLSHLFSILPLTWLWNNLIMLCLTQSFFSKRRVSNLEAYVEWFNRLSYLVATEICLVSIFMWKTLWRCGVDFGTIFHHQRFAKMTSRHHFSEISTSFLFLLLLMLWRPLLCVCLCGLAGEEEAQSSSVGVFHRRGSWMLQHRQL